jgi:hypothetical protein
MTSLTHPRKILLVGLQIREAKDLSASLTYQQLYPREHSELTGLMENCGYGPDIGKVVPVLN